MKYGFNPYLQLIFRLAHITMLGLVSGVPPLSYVYKFVYRVVGMFGRVYLEKRGSVRGN